MIPILFPADSTHGHTTFSGHGLGDLIEATKVEAEENSSEGHEWELSFEYPDNGELFSELKLNHIVLAKVNDYQNPQAFRIYSISKALNHIVTVACQHISYDLQNVPVKPFSEIGASDCLIAIKTNMFDNTSVQSQTTYGKQFTFNTNIPDPEHKSNPTSEAERDKITLKFEEPQNARALLFDSENSVVGKYGGDVIIDNYSIDFMSVGGSDRGISIDYGVDLVDFDQEKNISNMITGILPYYVKDKDVRIDIRTEEDDTIYDPNYNSRSIIKFNLDNPLILEANFKYTLTFTPENSGNDAVLNWNIGMGPSSDPFTFTMDGTNKKYEFTLDNQVTIPKDATLFYAFPNNDDTFGYITNITLVKNPIEPIVYGDIVTRNDAGYEYEVPKYEVPKIQPVNVTEYFANPNIIPTSSEVTSKGQEYVNKEDVGIPEVSLTVSYANLGDKEIRLYDAVQVRFVKMGVTVKSKVTRYKYDVLSERIIEIDVGKTKDSAIFSLQDASRLKHGLIKPDRLAKESITSDKLAKNSVGASQLDAATFTGGGWKMPGEVIDPEALKEKIGRESFKKGEWHSDPVLQSVPNNVYGGYDRNVGYLFDPSLGVPPDGLFGWTETDAQGKPTGRFHNLIETKMDQEYDFNSGGSVVKGMGYVLSPDFIFPKSIDAEKKIGDGTVKTINLGTGAVTEDKIGNGAIERAIYAHNDERKMKAWLDLYDGVGAEAVPYGEDSYMKVPFLASTRQFEIQGGDIAFYNSGGGGSYHFSPHTLSTYTWNNVTSTWVLSQQVTFLSTGNINIYQN